MNQIKKTPNLKALEINENKMIYGAFAEIGAGQEVARHFFQAGKASQTIAKTISAYDMIYSDEIYGKESSGRYVCESRLLKMLSKEYSLLQKRLDKTRGSETTFFAYANTVATSDNAKRTSHGWMGIRFQTKPNGPFNDIILHIRMMDKYRLMQQEALGALGTSLIHAAFTQLKDRHFFLQSLVENLKIGQIIIDMISFNGPDLMDYNNHLMNLELVRRGLAEAVLFAPDQSILTVADAVYGKSLIIERGQFRPLTNSHLTIMNSGIEYFKVAFPKAKEPLPVFEMTMHELVEFENDEKSQKQLDEKDFLDRVKCLTATGYHVLVSNFLAFYKLKQYLRPLTKEPIAMIIGANLLGKIFDEDFYQELEGGILEGLGKLLDSKTRVFVYPHKTENSCMTTQSFFPKKTILNIYKHFIDQKWIEDMAECETSAEFIDSKQIIEWIKAGDKSWVQEVPPQVAEMIQKENLFCFKAKKANKSK